MSEYNDEENRQEWQNAGSWIITFQVGLILHQSSVNYVWYKLPSFLKKINGVRSISMTPLSMQGAGKCRLGIFSCVCLSGIRSFRQRLVRQRLRSIRQRSKSPCQRPTGQFANVRYLVLTGKKLLIDVCFGENWLSNTKIRWLPKVSKSFEAIGFWYSTVNFHQNKHQ